MRININVTEIINFNRYLFIFENTIKKDGMLISMPVATSEISQGIFYLGDFIFLMCSNTLSQGGLRVHKQNRNKVIEYFVMTLYNMTQWLNGRRGPTIYNHLLILAHFLYY